jgi:hypothetical protein
MLLGQRVRKLSPQMNVGLVVGQRFLGFQEQLPENVR